MTRAIGRERVARNLTGFSALCVNCYYVVGSLVPAHQVWIDAGQVPAVGGFSWDRDKVGHLFWWAVE